MSNSLQPYGLHHTRLLFLSLSSRVCLDSCPLGRWCHPTIPSSAALFSFCLQSFPASGSFPMSRLFASGGQSIGASMGHSLEIIYKQWKTFLWDQGIWPFAGEVIEGSRTFSWDPRPGVWVLLSGAQVEGGEGGQGMKQPLWNSRGQPR